jgi:hypothetical protein
VCGLLYLAAVSIGWREQKHRQETVDTGRLMLHSRKGAKQHAALGGLMPRSMVGLLVAVGTAMSGLIGLTHGDVIPALITGAAFATGLAAYLALPSKKNLERAPLRQIATPKNLILSTFR